MLRWLFICKLHVDYRLQLMPLMLLQAIAASMGCYHQGISSIADVRHAFWPVWQQTEQNVEGLRRTYLYKSLAHLGEHVQVTQKTGAMAAEDVHKARGLRGCMSRHIHIQLRLELVLASITQHPAPLRAGDGTHGILWLVVVLTSAIVTYINAGRL
eukprot:1156561-Pelagomonas_calceolata.AAC.10